jgi:hypothetical protein
MSTESARSAAESAGFHGLVVTPDVGITDPTEDEIALRFNPPFFAPIRLVRFHSASDAKDVFDDEQGDYSRAALKTYLVYLQRHPKPRPGEFRLPLPRGFELRKVFSFRVCNVIIFSYNARLDPRLTARVNRAVAALRAKCH